MRAANRLGFTLIEIMVAIAVIALLATIIAPSARVRRPGAERKQFIAHLNGLMRLASQQAIVHRKLHRVLFRLKDNKMFKVEVQVKGEGKDIKGEQIFTTIKAPYLSSSIEWPKNLSVKQFMIEGKDEKEREGRISTEFWFFIIPEGLAQDVIINMVDLNDGPRGKQQQIGLVLNPFSVQFKSYDSFQK